MISYFQSQDQYSSGTLVGVPSWQAPVDLFEAERGGSLEPIPSAPVQGNTGGQPAPLNSSVFVGRGMPDPRRS